MADLGTDTDCADDIPLRDAQVSGSRNLGNALARRLGTPRGGLASIDEDADYGLDVRQLVGIGLTDSQRSQWQAAIGAECAKDERVLTVSATITFVLATQTLTVAVEGTAANGPFSLVLGVSTLSVDLLEAA